MVSKYLILGNRKSKNFVVFANTAKVVEWWKTWLLLFWFNKSKSQQCLTWNAKEPIYFHLPDKVIRFLATHFRFLCLVLPVTALTLISLNYTPHIWWYILLSLSIVIVFPFLVMWLYDLAMKIRVKAHILSITPEMPVVMIFGNWGAGKTSTMMYEASIKAEKQWKIIVRKYKRWKCYNNEFMFWKNETKKQRAKEIKETYEYYVKAKTIPCLWTTIPAFKNGKPANRIETAHLIQEKRMPYGVILSMDEISLILPQNMWRKKPKEIMELFKFGRQYLGAKFMQTEQAKEEAFNALRRVTTQNQFMIKQKWVLKARFLSWLSDFIVDHKKSVSRRLDTFLGILETFINHVGYRKYYYINFGNEYIEQKSKTKTYIAPSDLGGLKYDDRAFINAYLAKDKPLEISKWNNSVLTQSDINQMFLNEQLEAKKEAELRQKKIDEKKMKAAEKQAERELKQAEKENKKRMKKNENNLSSGWKSCA